MRVAQVLAPVAIAIATTSSAYAGPQSLLDPYANIKAPTTKSLQDAAEKKKAKPKPYAVPSPVKNPAADLPSPNAAPVKTPKIKTAASEQESSSGFVAGTKQV